MASGEAKSREGEVKYEVKMGSDRGHDHDRHDRHNDYAYGGKDEYGYSDDEEYNGDELEEDASDATSASKTSSICEELLIVMQLFLQVCVVKLL